MAKCRQPIKSLWWFPGMAVSTMVLSIVLATLWVLLYFSTHHQIASLWQDSYLWHVIRFTLWQASLSTLFSIIPAIFLARTLYRRHFPGRWLLLRFCNMTFILPILVAIYGLLAVYGQQGWLATLSRWVGLPYTLSIYGIGGILLAHVFFNFPFATRLFLLSLETVPIEQRKIARQLNMNAWQFFRFVEWPALQRYFFSTGSLIFMLCFASFAAVLTLGGGPKATTIEVAIYQVLTYDFNLGQAAILALIQLSCCLGLVLLTQLLKKMHPTAVTLQENWRDPSDSLMAKFNDSVLIALTLLFILPPLVAVVSSGINHSFISSLTHPLLWHALLTSLWISLAAGTLCVMLSLMLLWTTRELQLRRYFIYSRSLELCSTMILAMPSIVLATGAFLLFTHTIGLPQSLGWLIVIINALTALPYAIKILDGPMYDLAFRYTPLISSLAIKGWRRFYWIEFSAMKRPLTQAMAFACLLSIGDFGAIALFGSHNFTTLPYYLYQQIGSYRSQDGAVTALLLLLLCFILFTFFEKLAGSYDQTR